METMRGVDTFAESLFSMRKLNDFIPPSHPLRAIRVMATEALAKMDRLFADMYEADIKGGRPSIAPEKLSRAMLIQVLYSIRSERQLMEQVQYNLLFRWFIGLAMDDVVWVPTVFTKNRERLIRHDAVIEFFNEVVAIAQKNDLLSAEHFSVDGTLIQAWAGRKSFVRNDSDDQDDERSSAGDFRGSKRSNETHRFSTDPDARLYRKGKTASELRYMGHTLTGNRRRTRMYRGPPRDEGRTARSAKHLGAAFGGARYDCLERGLSHFSAKAQADRPSLWMGEDRGAYAPGDGTRVEEGGSDVRVEHGRIQPRTPVILGARPSIVTGNAEMRPGIGLKTLKWTLNSH